MALFGIELTASLVYSLGTIGMALGVLVAARGLVTDPERVVAGRDRRVVYGLMTWTCGVAMLSYLGMTLGIGAFTANGNYIETLRYVDWALTTPALVAVIGILAGASNRTVVAAAAADFLMIAVGYGASLVTGPLKWAGFLVSTGFFFVLAYYLFVPFGRTAKSESFERQALFEKVRNLTGVLWFVYPLVWLAGPSALDVMGVTATAAVVTYLDVTAKTGYTLILASSQGVFDGLVGREATEQARATAQADD
jgi:sensory rhodopsin